MLENILSIFDHPIFSIPDGIGKIIAYTILGLMILGVIYHIIRLSWRLWIWLHFRKIYIFSSWNNLWILKNFLTDSWIFREKNIIPINPPLETDKAKNGTLFLFDWESCQSHIDEILRIKHDSTALIIYAKPWSIPQDIMEKVGNKRNTAVVNFMGRLLNDILTSMITTSYSKK